MAAYAAADSDERSGAADRHGDRCARSLLWLMAFSGGFVFIEPGPYEFVGARDDVPVRGDRA